MKRFHPGFTSYHNTHSEKPRTEEFSAAAKRRVEDDPNQLICTAIECVSIYFMEEFSKRSWDAIR